jgi:alcohol dehydrogenase class IV
MNRFEFSTVSRIIFGEGVFRETASLTRKMGRRILLVSGLQGSIVDRLTKDLVEMGCETFIFDVVNEPTVNSIMLGLDAARRNACDLVLSLGGGSAIDTGKVISIMTTNPGEVLDYLEVIGKGKEIQTPGLPFIAIPTTAGTGAEVTRNAVIGSPEFGLKVSLRSPLMLPKVAIIDPELTCSLPPDVTAFTGLDALTQLIEPFVSLTANPMTDGLCREGIPRAAQSLGRVYMNGQDQAARSSMALASLFGGLALANAKLGAVHGFAGPIGGMFPVPHGAVCARLLPVVMDVNLRALKERQPADSANHRYQEIARMVTGSEKSEAIDGVRWIEDLCTTLQIPSLSQYGVTSHSIPELIEMAAKSSSMKGNPIQLTAGELREILERAI